MTKHDETGWNSQVQSDQSPTTQPGPTRYVQLPLGSRLEVLEKGCSCWQPGGICSTYGEKNSCLHMSPRILGEATYHQRLVSKEKTHHQYPHSNCHVVMTYLNHGVSHFQDLQSGSDADGIRLHEVAPFLQHCHGQKPLAHAIARHHGHIDADLTMPHLGRLRKT